MTSAKDRKEGEGQWKAKILANFVKAVHGVWGRGFPFSDT